VKAPDVGGKFVEIDRVSEEQRRKRHPSALDEFSAKHPTFFEKHNGDWRRHVVEEFHLSDTIDIAIWELAPSSPFTASLPILLSSRGRTVQSGCLSTG
jgi:hypothetical protein